MAADESIEYPARLGRRVPYAPGPQDRLGVARAEGAAEGGVGEGLTLAMWHGQCLLERDELVLLGEPSSAAWQIGSVRVLLGRHEGAALWAVDLSALPFEEVTALTGATGAADVRSLHDRLSPARLGWVVTAVALLGWHAEQPFCPRCGGQTGMEMQGAARRCERECGTGLLFPRLEPAVIVLVTSEDGGRCVAARHRGAGPDELSLLAGFVEVGESLEDAAAREIMEEVGLEIGDVRYRASQPWPFPRGLMVAFRAVAGQEVFSCAAGEIVSAHWLTRDDARHRILTGGLGGRRDSLELWLLEEWLAEEAG